MCEKSFFLCAWICLPLRSYSICSISVSLSLLTSFSPVPGVYPTRSDCPLPQPLLSLGPGRGGWGGPLWACSGCCSLVYPCYYRDSSFAGKKRPFCPSPRVLEGFGRWASLHGAVPCPYLGDAISTTSEPHNSLLKLIWLPPFYS